MLPAYEGGVHRILSEPRVSPLQKLQQHLASFESCVGLEKGSVQVGFHVGKGNDVVGRQEGQPQSL